jgi:Lactate racemase N-terminal domain
MIRVQQDYPKPSKLDLEGTLQREFDAVRPRLKPGARIAIGVGSRGITNLSGIIAAIIGILKKAGAQPFIIPAMGSHGGATAEGQVDVLGTYGITEAAMGVPIRASMEVKQVGVSEDGVPAYCSVEALAADGVIIVNRIKPHTDFSGELGSGVMKMAVIGLGKRTGANTMHMAATRIGYEQAIRGIARVIIREAPVLCGVGILENQFHDTGKLAVMPRESIEPMENQLLIEARNMMPLLPFEEIDLLIVDRMGKNISGCGMDPNVIGRSVYGYVSSIRRQGTFTPYIRRIFVRDLTEETHGNAIGLGLADMTTTRLVRGMDHRFTYINALTAVQPQVAKIPIYFDSDREAIEQAIASLAITDGRPPAVVRILDTLSVAHFEASEALLPEINKRSLLKTIGAAREMEFTVEGNLV